jgi:hypothetical protein
MFENDYEDALTLFKTNCLGLSQRSSCRRRRTKPLTPTLVLPQILLHVGSVHSLAQQVAWCSSDHQHHE